ncbi:2-amino-3,7-dideoxy-D-threo-hept-6-ulosonate synthase [Actinophytocola xanthii]|uniref:2-amino-4,5-dihydroxy-6-one-heptanoic acid-7-phosphate synthase n=1 Tax=Actinophytocola xanthii TaxID=1912961 RepID=A0A1Q8C5H4_9PSEU|nr:2-amino-3,7-dideoxy-D-threo-hept-6-ulosonate synthase [Actinophytocola xanthii]OLF09586.1 2-amino-4,5-dihydroxy-6-one-heptanoic acid-7-phosphate synthase [Actinophytocola xanthii]
MSVNHFARELRLRRLYRHSGERLFVVPLDHSVSAGRLVPGRDLDDVVAALAGTGVDAVVLHKGSLRRVRHECFSRLSLVIHLSASTVHAPDPDAKYLVSGVEEALRLGADAVSVQVNLGSRDERSQVADLGSVADVCDRWNVPLLAMMYPRGPRITDPRDPELVLHAAMLAADLGADIVKTPFAGTAAEMAEVTRACPIPLLVAGGPQLASDDEVVAFVGEALRGGVAGLAMGRNIFRAADPALLARRVAALVHGRLGGPRGRLESVPAT